MTRCTQSGRLQLAHPRTAIASKTSCTRAASFRSAGTNVPPGTRARGRGRCSLPSRFKSIQVMIFRHPLYNFICGDTPCLLGLGLFLCDLQGMICNGQCASDASLYSLTAVTRHLSESSRNELRAAVVQHLSPRCAAPGQTKNSNNNNALHPQ